MADDFKIDITLQANTDDKQISKEVQEAWDLAQKILDKTDLKLDLTIEQVKLEKELENVRARIKKLKAEGAKDLEFEARLEAKEIEGKLNNTKSGIKQVDEELKKLNNEKLNGVTDQVKNLWNETEKTGKKWEDLLSKFKKFENFVSNWLKAYWITKIGKAIIDLGNNAEQAKMSFTTMLWDANKAQNLLTDLSNFAKKTPFELTGIRDSAKQLLAMGVSAEEMIPTLKALWDVSAGLNVPLERLALNYGQVLTQWKMTGRELKDFTTAWVPILDELAKNLGKTKTEIQDMVSAGQIGAQDMVEAFRSMSSEGGRFADLMEQQSNTLAGKWSNFKDTLASIGETVALDLIPDIKDMVDKIGTWVDENTQTIQKAWLEIGNIVKTLGNSTLSIISEIYSGVNRLANKIGGAANRIADQVAGTMTDADRVTAEGLTGMQGNWSDFFYYLEQGITWIIGALRTLYNTAETVIKKVTNGNFWSWLYDAGSVKINPVEKGSNIFGTVGNWFKEQKRQLTESYNGMKNYIKDETKDVKDTWNKETDKLYKDLEDNYIKRISNFTSNTYKSSGGSSSLEWGGILGETLLGGSGSGGGKSSKAEDMLKEYWKTVEELYNDMDGALSDHQKNYDKLTDSIHKVEGEYEKLREEASKTWREAEKSLASYNEQLEKLQSDTITSLGQRYVELRKDLMGTDEGMKKRAEELSRKDIQRYQDRGQTEYKGYDLKKLVEVKEKLDEIRLIEENTTEEQRKGEEFTHKTSKAQELLNKLNEKAAELEEKKAAALEKQAIAQAQMATKPGEQNVYVQQQADGSLKGVYKDREGQRQIIHDIDNLEYAKQLSDQVENLGNQLEEYKAEKDQEVEILIDVTARKISLEDEYNTVFQKNVESRKKSLDQEIKKVDTLIAKMQEYLSMGWGGSARAYGGELNKWVTLVGENWPEAIIRRQASYVQPRNAVQSYSTVNNNQQSNNFSINGMNVNVNSVDEFLGELKNRLTYRN